MDPQVTQFARNAQLGIIVTELCVPLRVPQVKFQIVKNWISKTIDASLVTLGQSSTNKGLLVYRSFLIAKNTRLQVEIVFCVTNAQLDFLTIREIAQLDKFPTV